MPIRWSTSLTSGGVGWSGSKRTTYSCPSACGRLLGAAVAALDALKWERRDSKAEAASGDGDRVGEGDGVRTEAYCLVENAYTVGVGVPGLKGSGLVVPVEFL